MKQKTIVLGISGGIAAIKISELITYLKDCNIRIIPIMTKSACQIIDVREIEKVSGEKVYTSLFDQNFDLKKILHTRKVDHIEIADSADLVVVVPATANIIGKFAAGIADDFLTTTVLASTVPKVLCPSMNSHMWENSIVQSNLEKLKQHQYIILLPENGMLACGYKGIGRLPDINTIGDELVKILSRSTPLKGKKILVTSGGTIEKIDDVRYISNRSSGKMGAAIADACHELGAEVILLKAKNAVLPRYDIEQHTYETADDLLILIKQYASNCTICFHAAAVSDFSVSSKQGKISSNDKIQIILSPRKKLYRLIKKINPLIILITFKAEWKKSDKKLINIAKTILDNNNIDVIVANDVGKKGNGFEVDTNEVIVVKKNGVFKKFLQNSKLEIARQIIKYLFETN